MRILIDVEDLIIGQANIWGDSLIMNPIVIRGKLIYDK